MPLPLLLVVPALASLLGVGVKKGLDAKAMNNEAKLVGELAKTRHEDQIWWLNKKSAETNTRLEKLGVLKVSVFANQISHLVGMLKLIKAAKSSLRNFDVKFSASELKTLESAVQHSLELSSGLAKGAFAGGLAAAGATGIVGMLASASTGTAIATLSGVAASNATLAFLGGGTLAAGGAGVAGGMMVLGGVAAAPAIAITGFVMAGKAEESLTKAKDYEAKADVTIAEIKKTIVTLKGIDKNIRELTKVITHLAIRYDAIKSDDIDDTSAIQLMLLIGKALKQCLDQDVISSNGIPIEGIIVKYEGIMDL